MSRGYIFTHEMLAESMEMLFHDKVARELKERLMKAAEKEVDAIVTEIASALKVKTKVQHDRAMGDVYFAFIVDGVRREVPNDVGKPGSPA